MSNQTAPLPDAEKLTHEGFSTGSQGRILLIACGALAREILALKEMNGWQHIDLRCLPAILHNSPEKITDAVRASVEKHRSSYETIFVVYADCGTGGQLEKACADLGVEMVAGPHCYSFFEGNADFARHDDEITAFYLTDFLARQFDAFVWKPLGLDRHPELAAMYFGNYTKLVYQAQTDDPTLTAKAKDCADRLGLAFERRFTGYGDLAKTLSQWMDKES
ncbi:DUF1638 domain-containing protein [Sulfitobacter sp. BDSS02]|nr:DUF1638 domain-containing protein [Sulfitobacter sp. BDSS02]MBR9849984.1 DUF1638 domain-containing protein [Paracoccaceae bacterium]